MVPLDRRQTYLHFLVPIWRRFGATAKNEISEKDLSWFAMVTSFENSKIEVQIVHLQQ